MRIAAVVTSVLLGLVAGFQLLLALGRPLGRAAWGGRYQVLPLRLRWASGVAAVALVLAAWIALARADLAPPGPGESVVRIATWVFAAQFALNTHGNLASKSATERLVMTPVTLVLTACFVALAIS